MAHAKNMAHRLGILERCAPLVNVDAGNFTGPNPRSEIWHVSGFAQYLAGQFYDERRTAAPVFLWSRMVKDGDGRLPRGISGRIAVTAQAFLKSGGYDEQYNTWGPDDKDFELRLQRLGYEARVLYPAYLDAILHNDKMRFKEYRHAALESRTKTSLTRCTRSGIHNHQFWKDRPGDCTPAVH